MRRGGEAVTRLTVDDLGIIQGDEPLASRVPLSAWLALTDAEIARRANVSRERVRQIREKLSIPSSSTKDSPRPTWLTKLKLISDADWVNYSNVEISEHLGVPSGYVAKFRSGHGKPRWHGLTSSLHDITDEEWRTTPRVKLAERFGVTRHAVNNFMRRNNKPKLVRGKGAWKTYQEEERVVGDEDTGS